MNETRQKLLDATLATLRDKGLAGASARAIATTAGVNQALVFYHFGTVDELVDTACREATAALLAAYRDQFGAVTTLGELLALGRRLHAAERVSGNVAVLAQVVAGSQQDSQLATSARFALSLWAREIETTLDRLLRGSPLAGVTDVPGLAHGVTAAFIGIELYDGVDPDGATSAFTALEQLAVLVEVVDDLGPVARRALRSRIRRAGAAR